MYKNKKRVFALLLITFLKIFSVSLSVYAVGSHEIVSTTGCSLECRSSVAWASYPNITGEVWSIAWNQNPTDYVWCDIIYSAGDIYVDDSFVERLSDYVTDFFSTLDETSGRSVSGRFLEIDSYHYAKDTFGELSCYTYDYDIH